MTVDSARLSWDRRVLAALCDTLIPRISAPHSASTDEQVFWSTSASDLAVDRILDSVLPLWAPHVHILVGRTLDALSESFADSSPDRRDEQWLTVLADPSIRPGALIVQSTVLAMFYTVPDEASKNPTWPALGFAGPLLEPPTAVQFPKTLTVAELPDNGSVTLTVDAVVVGSGAGGGVAAARLAAAGMKVLVLEKGGYRNEPDLPQLEALSFPNLYLGGGFVWSTDASVGLLAGSTVGGGTTVNSMACLPTPEYVLDEWVEAGMEGASSDEFGPHIESVMQRINAVPANTVHNSVNRILNRGLDAAGLQRNTLARNAKDNDDRFCGECNAGCLVGCKQSTMKTFLQDASDSGAQLLPQCDVQEIVHADGRAVGVRAVVNTPDGDRDVLVEAPIVVVAAGALASPVLLQRSGLGGPSVGRNLHVHPSYFVSGVYDEVVKGWAGQILTSVSHDFEHVESEHGFVVEAAPMGLGFWTGLTPWHSGEQHKQEQLRLEHVSGVWGFVRDHGSGRVEGDAHGMPVVTWGLDDPVDLAVVRRTHQELARILRASGAEEIFTFLPSDPRWRQGDDFDAFLDTLGSLDAADILTLSAHQSGSCPTGLDPTTSVVNGRGRLHDCSGVYVADASALPTAPGVNPMVSIEAYARRTAEFIVQEWDSAMGRSAGPTPTESVQA
ncbi:GMC family oxidoreductase N-terminal domain-containing protein [Rhodococcus fascians]|nr:GMC family oxidoreductase N-terminal domain-containing protein [Rhodococcus fascians]MBY4137764.1 GMC family oxidoreductase N-terminal domain-containing protein [Rhodococcus fascians]MBY4215683.1 GMC family oxidoreductase N-terminal domain-containing protein [Rhodococcus fascians]MBY4222534.1 GMC family oxidoreductase N-terminal domain-containing protein [Rhodococcus fascians]MBY4233307.1 GMC family oxidoreductase N-terminal domain-containing protein [Rhodococcus fascians]